MYLFRYLLFPLSFLYYLASVTRNLFFDWKILKSEKIQEPSICIGNLSVGGSGKTPMTIYLANLLKKDLPIQILSRGYGRKSSGYREVQVDSTCEEVGDEPLLYKKRFQSEITIAVSENRSVGARKLNQNKKSILLLDDAFQHRAVKAGFSIILTPYQHLFINDFLMPVGNLREARCGAKRADCIVVTKCPESIEESEKNKLKKNLSKYGKPVFFSSIQYNEFVPFGAKINSIDTILLVCGIARPENLLAELSKRYKVVLMRFPDHHNFDSSDISKIHLKFDTFVSNNTAIITTEKDFIRLQNKLTLEELKRYPWYYLPIEIKIDDEFNSLIKKYVTTI